MLHCVASSAKISGEYSEEAKWRNNLRLEECLNLPRDEDSTASVALGLTDWRRPFVFSGEEEAGDV
jgi:hypothetical protein